MPDITWNDFRENRPVRQNRKIVILISSSSSGGGGGGGGGNSKVHKRCIHLI